VQRFYISLDPLRVYSQQPTENKSFIALIGLILTSHIDWIMLDRKLYKTMT